MGYSEDQYSLPRWQDLSISRQQMFDNLFHYTPSIGWMFLPLLQYHAGGAAAMFEPLDEHIKVNYFDYSLKLFSSVIKMKTVVFQAYEWGLAQYLGAGVAACYRGDRIYDTQRTKEVVKKWVRFYKVSVI